MKFNDTCFSREHGYSIGQETDSGQYYLSIPVSNGLVDYEEYYALSREQYQQFQNDAVQAIAFADACRQRLQDTLLIMKPGPKRGEPISYG
ncbi:hypothetical protein [Chitinilyticum aquatile]|uniref:hypothetical protein n=1 Tax=Chitinilyticum aquatile TaxID=362520 RepID=UPI000423430F|nr:hypothetical protein [Chitinilyticum aquatile]